MRVTWTDHRGTWRVQRRPDGRWQLLIWVPEADGWCLLGPGDHPNRAEALAASGHWLCTGYTSAPT